MSLVNIWTSSRNELENKLFRQIIALAGSGKLLDDKDTSKEVRDFLSLVPSKKLSAYALECLHEKFEDSGHALQDLINQIGRRLGFIVSYGRYRGKASQIGHDGLWKTSQGASIVVEVKTTDAYRLDLDVIAGYRRSLIKSGDIENENSSMLIVVGREDTGGLEAQIRGSKYAWDIRLISVDSLIRLLNLKEEIEDPGIMQKIRAILTPQEYTKVDGIIDLVFSTTENVKIEEELETQAVESDKKQPKFTPVSFNEACISKIEKVLNKPLVKLSRATYITSDELLHLLCVVSREHIRAGIKSFWFAFHNYQKEALEKAENSYLAFGCGSEKTILLIPFKEFKKWLDGMHTTQSESRFYWHVVIHLEKNRLILQRRKGYEKIELTNHLVK
ncbi:MAG: hypothetical protein K8I01_12155 [Candidatus Methylomirabilis sp.]|nr:hypothetical protein [Deltaproteobacteria bacterium]